MVSGLNDTIVGKANAEGCFRVLEISKECFDGKVVACASCIGNHFLAFESFLENGSLFFV